MRRWAFFLLLACSLAVCFMTTAGAKADPALDASPGQLVIDLGKQWANTEFSLETDVGRYPGKIVVSPEGVLTMELGQSKLYRLTSLGTTAASTPVPSLPMASSPTADVTLESTESNPIPLTHILVFLSGSLICIGIWLYFSKKRK